METIIPVISVIMFLGFLANRLNKDNKSDTNEKEENRHYDDVVNSIYESAHQSAEDINDQLDGQHNECMDSEIIKPDTQGLMFNTLSQLGCQPAKNDDGTLSVSYQGENFHMDFGGYYVRVWDPMWAGVKADDPDLPKIREAVNAANFDFGPTVVMTKPDEDGTIGLHTRRDIMLHPACPDNVPFVKAVLDSFFDAKENVRARFNQLNTLQGQLQKKRPKVGFTADNTNTDSVQ